MIKLPVDYNFFDDKSFKDLELIEIKYKLIRNEDKLLIETDKLPIPIRNIIVCMNNYSNHLFNDYDKCYLDVKVRNLKVGDSGDYTNEWHTDWVKEKDHPNKEETHFIYTNVYGTHYLDNDVEKQCDDNSIYKYHRDLHKSPVVPEDCKRVLVRLSFVDNLILAVDE